ncbi:MAG TPA: hypothetical protein PKC99_14245 [Anaerolineales bacterium]|nr:hypothetical protein [Anaerolineales bacterium]
MTDPVNVNFVTIAEAVSKLAISGVIVQNINKLPASAAPLTAALMPRPNGFVSDFGITVDSLGSGGNQQMTLTYTLNYNYYHCPIGSTLDFGSYAAMIGNIAKILVALLSNDVLAGAIDQLPTVSDVGPIQDSIGNDYHGCTFALRVTQYSEVDK